MTNGQKFHVLCLCEVNGCKSSIEVCHGDKVEDDLNKVAEALKARGWTYDPYNAADNLVRCPNHKTT